MKDGKDPGLKGSSPLPSALALLDNANRRGWKKVSLEGKSP